MCASSIFGGAPKPSVPQVVTPVTDDPEAERRQVEARRAAQRRALAASSRSTVFTSGIGDATGASLGRATLG